MTLNELILKHPQFQFLTKAKKFTALSSDQQQFAIDLIEDSMFWIDLEKKPDSSDGFKFLTAAYGLSQAHEQATAKGLEGKEKEKFIRPHQDLYTMYNPYSGNGHE